MAVKVGRSWEQGENDYHCLSLCGHVMKMHFKYLCLHSWICVAFSLGERSSFLRMVTVNEETHIWVK